MRTAVAGTFNILHEGHKRLLDRAFEGSDEVLIGITSDKMASSSRDRIVPYNLRKKAVDDYVSRKNIYWTICEINDTMGHATSIKNLDRLVVSEESYENAKLINGERERKGLRPVKIDMIRMVSKDGDVIHARDIMSGEMSSNGAKDAIVISVGSMNPVKTEAVRSVMERIFGSVRIIPRNVTSDVPEQPWGEDTCQGAINRAKHALVESDMSVGIEAGVFEMYGGLYDIQHCAILDNDGNMTIGMSSGFRYPDDVAELVRKGSTVGSAMKQLHSEDRGHAEGAVGVLSNGLLDRKELTEQSVIAAMIPRMNELNGSIPKLTRRDRNEQV